MKAGLLGTFLLSLASTTAASQTQLHELVARAKSLELNTPYVPPPGDPLAHHAAGYAKVMCSAVFITGLAPDFAAENVGFFTAPYEVRAILGKPVIDRVSQVVHVTLPNGTIRTAKYLGSQGCVTLPSGESAVHFTPVAVKSQLPDSTTEPWPMGDVLPKEALPAEIEAIKLSAAVKAAFEPPEALTAAFIVTWKGRLIADGVWNGERILPAGYAKFVSTPSPAWVADKRPIYGAFFWINGDGQYPVPRDSYYMAGAGDQVTMIVPSHDLVVVRMGHYKGETLGAAALQKALALLMEAVPRRK